MSKIFHYIKNHKVILAVDLLLLVIYFVLTMIAHDKVDELYSQQEAARWESDGDMSYAQVSAFISPQRGVDVDVINGVRSSLQSTLVKDSYAEAGNGGRVWIDAYSCETDINLRKDSNTLSVTAVGVGGDFFQFHPMTLLSGSYISDEDLNHDRIVVDENFAWAMFGSNDIVGMQVWLGDSIYFIAGVVKVDDDKISQIAYGNGNRIYMSYSELKKNADSPNITCYEVIYPNPISNYALNTVKNAFGLSDENEETLDKKDNPLSFDDVEVIENSNRYKNMELIMKMKNWRFRSMRTSSVGYPFWENIARVQDDTQMILLILRGILLICPIISFIWLIYGLWELKTWTIKSLIIEEFEKERERMIWKAYEKRMEEEEGINSSEEDAEAENFEADDSADGEEQIELKSVTDDELFKWD